MMTGNNAKEEIRILIDVEAARKTLMLSAGSAEEFDIYKKMSNEEVIDRVLKHSRCWGITRLDNPF